MKKALLVLLFTITFSSFFVLNGCSKNSVSNAQLMKDLQCSEILLDDINNCFKSAYVFDSEYIYSSHKISKRQTNIDDKEDIFHLALIFENKYFRIDCQAILNYIYYDEGGWILENISLSNEKITPLISAEKDLIIEYITNEAYQNITYVEWYDNDIEKPTPNLETGYLGYIDIEKIPESYLLADKYYYKFGDIKFDQKTNTTLLETTYSVGDLVKAYGDIRLFFDEQKGWKFLNIYAGENNDDIKEYPETPVLEIKNVSFDYTSALGKFKGTSISGGTLLYNIHNIDVEKRIIEYTFHSTNDPWGLPDRNDEITADIDLYQAKFGRFSYNVYDDCWYCGDVKVDRVG